MNPHDAAIHYQVFQTSVSSECFHHMHPNTVAGPATVAHIDSMAMTVDLRRITPRLARTSNPEHRFDKLTVIACRDASIMGLAW